MYDVTAGAEEERVPQRRFTLSSVLLVAAAMAFVTALIMLSREPSPAWFLYVLPIILGALAYDIAGGVMVTALCAGALFLAAPLASLEANWPELTAGFAVFLVCGVVVGFQARRQRTHNIALERASSFDSLTGVLKASAFISALGDETRRGDRYGHDLGLVLVRVEGFEEFTRLFGHYKAESMLQHLADIIRLTVRDTDTVGQMLCCCKTGMTVDVA
jgi:predicted signal transduction protein with EAL and GGDEF domain